MRDLKRIVIGAADPNGAAGLKHGAQGLKPLFGEFKILGKSLGFVPFAFVDAHPAPALDRNPAVRQEVWRVGKCHCKEELVLGDLFHHFHAIALAKAEGSGVVFEVSLYHDSARINNCL